MKGFTLMLAAMLIFGAAIGGAFVAGIAVEKGGDAEASVPTSSIQVPSLGDQAGGATGGGSLLEQLQSQLQSGDLTPQDFQQLRQQFGGGGAAGGGGFTAGGFGGGGAGGGALRGTVDAIDGNTITLNTAQGPLQVTIAPDTTIQVTTEGAIADLSDGMTLTVTGERAEDGTFNATNVFSLPEGAQGFGGGGRGGFGGGGGGFGGGQ